MKIITWNCQGAFRKKADKIFSLNPDIVVVQECEDPDNLKIESMLTKPHDFYWYNDSGKRGIAVITLRDFKIELLPTFNPKFRYVLPLKLSSNSQTINLFAVWAMNNREERAARYIGQVWFALEYYQNLLDKDTLIIGDFNSNKIWDYKKRVGSHTDVVNKLADLNIYSTYHRHYGTEQGKEAMPTFYLFRKQERPYHIDYCFASSGLLNKLQSFEIGKYADWTPYSDHMPLTIQFDI